MSIVLRGLIYRICIAYLEDVIVFSKQRTSHLDDLRTVFLRLRFAGLKLKPSKCQLFRDEVLYLNHVINASGVSPDPSKLRVLSSWPVCTTVKEMQSFFGFVNFYIDYVADSTQLTAPLYALTVGKKGTDNVSLGDIEMSSFNELTLLVQRALCAGPQLAHPDLTEEFVFYSDASKFAIGAVIHQRDAAGVECPVSFFSKKLSSAQQKITRRTSVSASPSCAPSSTSASIYSAVRSVCAPTIERCNGSCLRSLKRVRASVAGSRR